MDGAASIIAVVSLTLQLIQTVDTIKTFVQNVKGASKELERLVEWLDRLNALLQDVREVMKRQTSLRGFPLPSNTIFACLRSCEKSLSLLEDVVKKYGGSLQDGSSAVKRWKGDVKLAFKAKDIATFEARVQRDINDLHAALGTNTTNILTTVLPIMLLKQDTTISSSSVSYTQNYQNLPASNITATQTMSLSSSTPHRNIRTRGEWIESPLNRFGIRQKRTTKFMRMDSSQNIYSGQKTDTVISECYETTVSWNMLGYACRWTRQYPYGNILPSLRVHPVVNSLRQYGDLINSGTTVEIQQAFVTGALHPFVTGRYGETLLDVAVHYHRPDIYRLLQEYGVKPTLDCHGMSALESCLLGSGVASKSIDMLRLILPDSDLADKTLTVPYVPLFDRDKVDAVAWLWVNAIFHLCASELITLRIRLAQSLVARYDGMDHKLDNRISELLVELMDVEMIKLYERGGYPLLPEMFGYGTSSVDSNYLGSTFLKLLARLGLDVETCVRREIDNIPSGILNYWPSTAPGRRRLIFENFEDGNKILRWEWVYDISWAGHLVVAEFSALAGDADPDWTISHWPFIEFCWINHDNNNIAKQIYYFETPKQIARFERRAATKARKERARMGQKRPRSKMPGAWI